MSTSTELTRQSEEASTRMSEETTFSEHHAPRPNPARGYNNVHKDILRQKRIKGKHAIAEAERSQTARAHMEAALEEISANHSPGSDTPCRFDVKHVGLGGAKIKIEQHKLEDAKDEVKSSKSSKSTDDQPSGPSPIIPASQRPRGIYIDGQVVRFNVPEHAVRRQQSADEEIPWFNNRVRVSTLPVRFEIPMDVRKLADMDIKSYLTTYCKIPKARMLVYQRFFKKHKKKTSNVLTLVEFPKAIHDVLYNCVSEEAVAKFLLHLQIKQILQDVDLTTFAVFAAATERVLYLSFAEAAGPVPPGAIQSFEECADFGSLRWKLRGVEVNPILQRLLSSLGSGMNMVT